jgi:nitrite reductase/ring-hydroxylating ferredoxin subunit
VTDWQHTEQRARRLGLVHGLLNTVAAALYTTSVVQRQRRQRSAGRWWALLGFMVANGAAYLGGQLVYSERIGVNHAARDTGPRAFTPVLAAPELADGQMRQVEVEGIPVMLARYQGHIYALVNTCSHLGGPLCEGTLAEGNVRCPWHGSCFALKDGRVVDGPATYPQPWFETRVQNGQIEIRAVHAKNG